MTTFTIHLSFSLQTILASDVNSMTGHQLRTFGWSLTSGVDVDNNEYQGECLLGAVCVCVCVWVGGWVGVYACIQDIHEFEGF